MNQILVNKKIYVTPGMQRKKRFYKIDFIISIFLVCILFSYYIYAEYDKNKSEEVSKEILQGIAFEKEEVIEQYDPNKSFQVVDGVIMIMLDYEMQEERIAQSSRSIDDLVNPEVIVPEEQRLVTKDGTEYYTIGTVNISKLNVNYPILSTYSDELLKISTCKFWGPNPNEVGNLCIVAHNYRNNKFFSKISKLENGDTIEITDLSGRTISYAVYDKFEVYPTNVECTSQVTDGKREITLITCTNDSKRRTIIKATEM